MDAATIRLLAEQAGLRLSAEEAAQLAQVHATNLQARAHWPREALREAAPAMHFRPDAAEPP